MEIEESRSSAAGFRYPGIQPFKVEESDIFFGRDQEIQSLFDHILLNQVSVLFSKSGLGKSSLLNAGLIPLLKKQAAFFATYIRFKSFLAEQETSPTYLTRRNLVRGRFQHTFLDKLIDNEPSLWHDVKEQQIIAEEPATFVLIFDQFEELFTYPQNQIEEFKVQLAELLFTKVPQRYRDLIEELQENGQLPIDAVQLEQIFTPPKVKVLFSIRSDKMHLLNQLSDYIPSILLNAFELQPLDMEQAQDAIYYPALSRAGHFNSPRFDYSPDAVNAITGFLSAGQTKPIESFQLQIICNAIEKKVIRENLSVVGARDLGDLNHLIENYYLDQLDTIPDDARRQKAQRLIEEGLIFEPEQRRISLYAGQIRQIFGIDQELLEQLINCRLIRSEALPDGGYAYELSHDSLVAPILKIKENRKAEEEKNQLEKQAREAREKVLRARRINIALGALALLTGLSLIFSFSQYSAAKNAKNEIAVFAEKYSFPKLSEAIENLNYQQAFEDINSIKNSIQSDSIIVGKMLEIAFVFHETGQLEPAKEAINTIAEMGKKRNRDIDQGLAWNEFLTTVEQTYNFPSNALYEKYYPRLSRPILIGLDSVAFAETETTVWQFYVFCQSQGLDINQTISNWGLHGNFPVVKVDWYEAISYANWLSERQGLTPVYQIRKPDGAEVKLQEDFQKDNWEIQIDRSAGGYRLPGLEEWRAAARFGQSPLPGIPFISGPTDFVHSSDPDIDSMKATISGHVWYLNNSLNGQLLEPHPVAQKLPNPLGLYDMSGNLWEWCEEEDFDPEVTQKLRIVAGGAFNMPIEDCAVDSKNNNYAFYSDRSVYNTIGFRLCRTVQGGK